MLTRYWDRRRQVRVPVREPVRWHSGPHSGHCELVDLSPAGAGLRMPVRRAMQLGSLLSLEVELGPGRNWWLARDARVVRRRPDQDGTCVVGVEFRPVRRAW